MSNVISFLSDKILSANCSRFHELNCQFFPFIFRHFSLTLKADGEMDAFVETGTAGRKDVSVKSTGGESYLSAVEQILTKYGRVE